MWRGGDKGGACGGVGIRVGHVEEWDMALFMIKTYNTLKLGVQHAQCTTHPVYMGCCSKSNAAELLNIHRNCIPSQQV